MRSTRLAVVIVALVLTAVPVRSADEAAWQDGIDAAERAEEQGRVADAEAALVAALRESRRAGTAPLLYARSLEALADFYQRTQRPDEAEPLYVRAIEQWEQILGPAQPRLGIPLHNLATLYLERCRVEDALPLVHRVLALWSQTLGADDPNRVTAIRTEATLLRRCGREPEAAELESLLP